MGKYYDIWTAELSFIIKAIHEGNGSKKLDESEFTAVGNRKASGYGFRLDISNGDVPVKSGSAVARDLKRVLDESTEFKKLAQGKNIIINMGKDFNLNVKVD